MKGDPVGRIDFLAQSGCAESVLYFDEEKMKEVVEEENYYGVPMSIVIFEDEDGNHIDSAFVASMDPPPQGFRIEPFT